MKVFNTPTNKKLVVPTVLSISSYLLAYQLPKILVNINRVNYLSSEIDNKIPVCSPFIIIYVLAFLQWSVGILIVSKQDTDKGYYMNSAIIIGSIIGMLCFFIYPTGVHRELIVENNIFDKLLNLIYTIDNDINSCPSFHCYCSWLVFRFLNKCDNVDKKFVYFNLFFSVLVFLSTLFTKQHVLIDIPGGIILAELSMLLAKKISLRKLFDLFAKEK